MDQDTETIERTIEQTRERMGETVEALAYKTDVPARTKDAVNERVDGIKGALSDFVDSVKSALGVTAASAQSLQVNAAETRTGTGAQASVGEAVTQMRTQLPSGTADPSPQGI